MPGAYVIEEARKVRAKLVCDSRVVADLKKQSDYLYLLQTEGAFLIFIPQTSPSFQPPK